MAKKTPSVSEVPSKPEQQPSTTEKLALYALWGSLGTAFLSAVAQVAVAWVQRH